MSFTLANIVIAAAVLIAWSVMILYCRRRARRAQREAAMWAEFSRCHPDLDGELDVIWHRR